MADVSKNTANDVVIVSSSFPSINEIVIQNDDISIDVQDPHTTDVPAPDGEQSRENIRSKHHGRSRSFKDDPSHYAEIGIHVDDSEKGVSEPNSPKSPKSPTSMYMVGGSLKKPKLELKDREVSTRQCKFEIGEELEQFRAFHANKSLTSPPSPHIEHMPEKPSESHDNPGYAPTEPGAVDSTDAVQTSKDPFPFHFLFTTTASDVLKQHQIVPNPHNKYNHRFHSALQCPCCLFFFFLCCLPAVHFMQKSDSMFKTGNNRKAKTFGKASTGLYVIGTIVGVAFLAVSIYFAADYVRGFVEA